MERVLCAWCAALERCDVTDVMTFQIWTDDAPTVYQSSYPPYCDQPEEIQDGRESVGREQDRSALTDMSSSQVTLFPLNSQICLCTD